MFRFVEPPKNFQIYVEIHGEVGNYDVRGICAIQSTKTILYSPDLILTHHQTNREIHLIPSQLGAVLLVDRSTKKLTLRGISVCPMTQGHVVGLY
jgi:hypothetical protein